MGWVRARATDHAEWGFCAKRNARWLYRNSEGSRKFEEATDVELMLQLEKRGFKVLYPAHQCVDRPNLACPACQRDSLPSLRIVERLRLMGKTPFPQLSDTLQFLGNLNQAV